MILVLKFWAGSPEEKITEGLGWLKRKVERVLQTWGTIYKMEGVCIIFQANIRVNYQFTQMHMHLQDILLLVQECKMVPIVEPEVLMDGDHSAEDCFNKTSEVLKKCFEDLILNNIDLSGIILKPNMILSGASSDRKISNEESCKTYFKMS